MGGVSAAVSKTAAAPIERIKLLIQNQVGNLNFNSGEPWLAKSFQLATSATAVASQGLKNFFRSGRTNSEIHGANIRPNLG